MIALTVRAILAFALACLVAGVITTSFVVTPADIMARPLDARFELLGVAGLLALAATTQSLLFAAPFAAVCVAFAYWMRARSPAVYIASGLLIALLGFSVQFAAETPGEPTIVNAYAMAAYATAGGLAGWVFWLVAGYKPRYANARRQKTA